MKFYSVIKNFLISIIVFLFVVYLSVYLILPYFLNKKDYSSVITDKIKEGTGLVLLIDNYNLSVSPSLNIKLFVKEVSGFYPNKVQFVSASNAEFDFSPLALLKKELLIKKIKADKFQFSTKLLSEGKTTLEKYLDENIKSKNDYILSKKTPDIDIKEYIIKIKDEKSAQKLKFNGNNFRISQNADFRYVTLFTSGNVYISDKKLAAYSTKLEIPKDLLQSKSFSYSDIDLKGLASQNFSAVITSDLKIHSKNSQFDYVTGKINIDEFVMKIGSLILPQSYFHIITDKGRASVVSKFYTNINELTDIVADVRLKKPYSANIKCRCENAMISNLHRISIALFDMFNIPNNLSEFKVAGVASSDFEIFINEKSLKSSGTLRIKNTSFSHKSVPLNITGVNALVDFSDNKLSIKKADALVNNQPVKLKGTVYSDTTGDIVVSGENLDFNHLVNAFPFIKLDKNIILSSGKLSFDAGISGKLLDSTPIVNAVVKNLSGRYLPTKTTFSCSDLKISSKLKKNIVKGSLTALNLKLYSYVEKSIVNLKSDKVVAFFDDKNIMLNPAKFSTGSANFILQGSVKNYISKPDIALDIGGSIDTLFLKSFLNNQDMQKYGINVQAKGYLPVKLSLKSFGNKITADLMFLANQQNYITPIIIDNLKNKTTLAHFLCEYNTDFPSAVIKDFSLYNATGVTRLDKDLSLSSLKKYLSIKGHIKNLNSDKLLLDNLKISTIEPLVLQIPFYKKSSVKILADAVISGDLTKNPIVSGSLQLLELSLPEYSLFVKSIFLTLKNNNIAATVNSLKLDDTILDATATMKNDVLSTNSISSINVDATYIDFEKLMQVLETFFPSKYSAGIDVPYDIETGKLSIKSFKYGLISAQNITADFKQKKNKFYISNLFANAYGGKIAGLINYNLPYSSIEAKIQGRNLNAESATTAFLSKEQRISGSLNLDADVMMRGLTFNQQLSTMKGNANILINNGHFGQLGRFEHFLYAQNLLSQKLIYASLNSAKQAISPKDTGRFTYLKCIAKFGNGYLHLNPVLTSGPQMSMYITGRINMINNNVDLKILGKISSEVSSSLGLLGKLTIKDFLDEHTKYGEVVGNLFNSYNSEIPKVDISQIPNLSPDLKYSTKNFRVMIDGDPNSIKSVKSFTWVNPIGSVSNVQKNSGINNTKQNIEQEQSVSSNQVEQTTLNNTASEKKSDIPSFLDNIPDNFR